MFYFNYILTYDLPDPKGLLIFADYMTKNLHFSIFLQIKRSKSNKLESLSHKTSLTTYCLILKKPNKKRYEFNHILVCGSVFLIILA